MQAAVVAPLLDWGPTRVAPNPSHRASANSSQTDRTKHQVILDREGPVPGISDRCRHSATFAAGAN